MKRAGRRKRREGEERVKEISEIERQGRRKRRHCSHTTDGSTDQQATSRREREGYETFLPYPMDSTSPVGSMSIRAAASADYKRNKGNK